jgi:hypothetical protein
MVADKSNTFYSFRFLTLYRYRSHFEKKHICTCVYICIVVQRINNEGEIIVWWEKFEHFKGVITRWTNNSMAKRKKGQTAIYKTLHKKLKIE